MTPGRRTTIGDRCAAAVLLAIAAAGGAAGADAPKLTAFSKAEHALVSGAAAEVYVKLFSWEAAAGPMEVRCGLTDWTGRTTALGTLPVERVAGQWVRVVAVELPRFGPYEFQAELHKAGQAKPLATARLPLIRPVPVPELTDAERAASSIGVNTHFNAPWGAFQKMGIHWARDYCWGWLGFGEQAPRASNNVDFAKIHRDAQSAGIVVLPVMMKPFRTDDGRRYIDDAQRIADAFERLSKAFPAIPFWELDNESDLQFRGNRGGWAEYWASYVKYIQAADAGLRKAGAGAKVALNGDAGIYPDRTADLLASPAKDSFAVSNFHYYTGTVPPELCRRNYNPGEGGNVGSQTFLDELRGISRLAHEHGRQAWLTEVGWDVTYGPAVGARLQAIYLARMYLLARCCGVDKTFWFFDRDGDGTNIFSSCGLLDLGGNARGSAAALAAVSSFTARAEYAGSIDLGADRWCLLFHGPEGQWLAAAWSVQAEHPVPDALAGAKAADLFGNEIAPKGLTPEVTYFRLTALPAGWDEQRRAEMLSPTLLNVFPGGSGAVEVRLPEGASLTLSGLGKGLTAGPAASAGGVASARVQCAPAVKIGEYSLAAVATGNRWRRAWPLVVNVVPPLIVSAEPYVPGEPAVVALRANGDTPLAVSLKSLEGGEVKPGRLTVPPGGATAQYTAAGGASGPVKVVARLDSGVEQAIVLRPARLNVVEVGGLRLDGKLDDWPAAAKLAAGVFVASDPAHRSEVYLGWSPEGLWLAVRAEATQLQGGLAKNFWQWSNLELFVDASGEAKGGWPAGSHQFWFMPVREGDSWRALAGEWKRGEAIPATLYDDRRGKTAIAVGDAGYTMEAFVPAVALGAAPQAGKTWRAAIAAQTNVPNQPHAQIAWPRGKADGILDGPARWGQWRLAPAERK